MPVHTGATEKILISIDDWEKRAVLLKDNFVYDYHAELTGKTNYTNAIFKGLVKSIRHSIGSAFVNIGLDRNAFLTSENSVLEDDRRVLLPEKPIRKNDVLLVQVLKPPVKGKGARVTEKISLPGRYVVLFPESEFLHVSRKIEPARADKLIASLKASVPPGYGLIIRSAALEVDKPLVEEEINHLIDKWHKIKSLAKRKKAPALIATDDDFPVRIIRELYEATVSQVIVDSKPAYEMIKHYARQWVPDLLDRLKLHRSSKPLFEAYHVEEQLDTLLRRTITLPSGGYVVIDRTEALTVFDVNSGRFTEGKDLEHTAFQVNLEAAEEIYRQIRLRNISGIIVIDFIDMHDQDHIDRLLERINELCEQDSTRARMLELMPIGLVAITRKGTGSIDEDFSRQPCKSCDGSGFVPSDEAVAVKVLRMVRSKIISSEHESHVFRINDRASAIISRIFGEEAQKLKESIGKKFYFIPDSSIDVLECELLTCGSDEDIKRFLSGYV